MGIQTVASQGGGVQQSQIQSLAGQGSLYGLTLNEVQSHLGEPLGSMNLDELLKNVFPADENQSLAMDIDGAAPQYTSGSGLQRQGSITMTRAVSKRTVEEVWKDIQEGKKKKSSEDRIPDHDRQSTLGEMTLEDFLVKAGVVVEVPDKKRSNLITNVGPIGSGDPMAVVQGFAPGAHWLQQYHQMPAMQQQQQQAHPNMMGVYAPGRTVPQPLCSGTGPILDAVYHEGQMAISSAGELSDTQTPGRKRVAPGEVVEKTVERRQKRMIKNRESAARSRARKQAYTNELENKVSRLEEENEKLKKQKELDKILHYVLLPEPKHQLRRTTSAPL